MEEKNQFEIIVIIISKMKVIGVVVNMRTMAGGARGLSGGRDTPTPD